MSPSNMPSQPDREAVLFALAIEKPVGERAAFLQAVCGNDPALRQRLEALLAAHEQPAAWINDTEVDAPKGPASLTLESTEGAGQGAVGQTIGRYKLLEQIGEGGCGVVYVAEQTEPVRRRVALKVIKLGMDTKAVVARFEAERQALAMMDHPNIAKVLDAGTTGESQSQIGNQKSQIQAGRPYFVMELVRGIRITDYCDQEKISTRDRLDLFIQVCHAIQHAHQKGIIHRDIKPSNILVTLHDGVPVPKVIDFGIAKATEGRLTDATVYTQLHQFIGTPAYMSPEQAEMSGLDVDTRSDIYSLGVLLYELLAGSTPFDAKELMASGIDAMRKTIRETEPQRPSTRLTQEWLTRNANSAAQSQIRNLKSKISEDLDWIVMKCLEKDRTRRYETANGLAADLKRHLSNEPVLARPPSAAYRFQKAFRRNKLLFAAVGGVGLALVLGLGISLWQYAGKSRAEREQQILRLRAEAKAREASEAREQVSKQRDLARERLYESLVREAQSIRKARQVGYRREVFDRLKQAIALGTTNAETRLLRSEAAASLGDWVGLDPVDIEFSRAVPVSALTPDGVLAALAGIGQNTVSLRETRTGREVASISAGGGILNLAFDPKGLALFIVACETPLVVNRRPQGIRIEKWAMRGDGSWQREWTRPSTGFTQVVSMADGVLGLALGQSDSYFAVLDVDRNVELVRAPVNKPIPWHPYVDISSDRRHLAYLSQETQTGFDTQLEVWDLETQRRLAEVKPRLGPGAGLFFAPDAGMLVATYDSGLVVHDLAPFDHKLSVAGAFDSTTGATIGGSGGLLAVPMNQEFAVRLVDLQSGRETAFLKTPTFATGQEFSRDGSVLLLRHNRGCRVVHLRAERERLRLEAHHGGVPAVEFSPDGHQLASVGKDRTLRLWDLASPGRSRELGLLPAPGQTVAFTPDGQFLVCGYYNIGELSIWSTQTGKQVGKIDGSADFNADFNGTTWSVAVSADGKHLAAIGEGLRVWNLAELIRPTSSGIVAPLFSETNGVSAVVFDPLGKHVAFQDVLTRQPFISTVIRTRGLAPHAVSRIVTTNAHGNYVQGHGFLPKSGGLAYVTREREVIIAEPETGRVLRKFPTRAPGDTTQSPAKNMRVSPDESRLAIASPSGFQVDLWDPATGKLLYTLPEEIGSIWWIAWSPNSQQLAVTHANGVISIWNLKEVETQLAQLGLQP